MKQEDMEVGAFPDSNKKLSCAEWIRHFCFAFNPSEPLKLAPPPIPAPPDQSRLRQPSQPEPSKPIRWRGAAGAAAAGGAYAQQAHVSVEGGHCAGLAGGCHGNAHVHARLLRECQEWEGKCLFPSNHFYHAFYFSPF